METEQYEDRATPERRYEDLQGLYERLSDQLTSSQGAPNLDVANALARTSMALSMLEDAIETEEEDFEEDDEEEE